MLEGSASIRTVPLGTINERKGREKPSQSSLIPRRKAGNSRFALHWIQEIHRRAFLVDALLDLNVVSLWPIAIVPATPSPSDGLCGPEQRNGVGSSRDVGKTLGHRRLLCLACCTASQTQQQGRTSAKRRFSVLILFACTAKSEDKPSCASDMRFVVRFCAH